MKEEFIRTSYLLGEDSVDGLSEKKVAVFGVGGVGGYTVEALARCGIGTIALIDKDTVSVSNINRQIIALHSTVGRKKTDVMAERIADINPDIRVIKYDMFFLPENADAVDFTEFDYIVDAVDTVTAKLTIITKAAAAGVPVISAMGAGNRLDPAGFKVTDIYKTSGCPLARVMRRELKKRGIDSLKVVYSEEPAVKPIYPDTQLGRSVSDSAGENDTSEAGVAHESRKDMFPPGSIAFVPSVAGLIIAGEVVRDLCDIKSR